MLNLILLYFWHKTKIYNKKLKIYGINTDFFLGGGYILKY